MTTLITIHKSPRAMALPIMPTRERLFLQACSEIRFSFSLNEAPDGKVNEPAPVSLGCNAVEDDDGFVRQNNVDSFAHGL